MKSGWPPLKGDRIEIRQRGLMLRRGSVETVMPDCSGFWLAADGVETRYFVHFDYTDLEVWACSCPEGLLEMSSA
jgi:hypothetical protein